MPCWTFFLTFFLVFLSSAIPAAPNQVINARRRPKLSSRRCTGARQRTLRALAGAGVRVGALAANGQAPAVTKTTVCTEIHQPLDVHRDLTAEVAFDLEIALENFTDATRLVVAEVLRANALVPLRLGADRLGGGRADAVDVLERDDNPLLAGKINAGDACHVMPPESWLVV